METTLKLAAELTTYLGAVQTVVAALFALIAFVVTRTYYVRDLEGKLRDRLFELSKLAIQFSEVAQDFDAMANSQDAYFRTRPPTGALGKRYFELRGYTYFRLTFYEEAFVATQGPLARHTQKGRQWRSYVAEKMKHKLVRELFDRSPQQFNQRFARLVQEG